MDNCHWPLYIADYEDSVKMHDGDRCVLIKGLVVKGKMERREMVGEKASRGLGWRSMKQRQRFA